MDKFKEYLLSRNIPLEVVERIENEKIDPAVICLMSDKDLQQYFPSFGDRIAVVAFAKKELAEPSKSNERKKSLGDILKGKMHSSHSLRSRKQLGNENAKKSTRRLEVGWIKYNKDTREFKQIYEKKGGGIKHISVDVKTTMADVMAMAKTWFFKKEKTMGDCRMTDSSYNMVELDVTVEQLYDEKKTKLLRVYIETQAENMEEKKKSKISKRLKLKQHEPEEKNAPENVHKPEVVEDTSKDVEYTSLPDIKTPSEYTSNLEDTLFDIDIIMEEHSNVGGFSDSLNTNSSSLQSALWEDSSGEIAFTRTKPVFSKSVLREPREFKIVVHRGRVLRELLNVFIDKPDVDFDRDIVTAHLVLPNGDVEHGEDNGGVMRDMLAEFWNDFYDQCTNGNLVKVPCLRHDFDEKDWKAVGHVVAMGWKLQNVLPILLAPSFLSSCLYAFTGEDLRDEFFRFITPSEQATISKALDNFQNTDAEELEDVLSNHDCKVIVTEQNLPAVIDQIAHKELVQEPSFIKECMFDALQVYTLNIDLKAEYGKMVPTSKKVLSIIDCDEPDSDSFKYFKRYIREIDADPKMLRALLRFVTASDLLLHNNIGEYHRIQVKLVHLTGLSRRPVAHTCGRVLELPKAYESYPVFKHELNCILSSNVWVMDII